MRRILEGLSYFNWFGLPLTLLQSLWHADWKHSNQRYGSLGVLVEALTGTNAYPFFIPTSSHWSGAPVARLLKGKGISIWDVGYANGEMFFRVRKNQARWAQYVMTQAGVPLTHRLYAGK